jgi:hypothetical protein
MNNVFAYCFVLQLVMISFLSCNNNIKQDNSVKNSHESVVSDEFSEHLKVTSVPKSFNFNNFYRKYIDAKGIPILSSDKVPDTALIIARQIVIQMLNSLKVVGIEQYFNAYNVRIAVMSKDEVTTDIPEHSDLNEVFPETNWDTRGRGFGATIERPATSCAEENLLCYSKDPYKGESILVHEFAHTIHEMGLRYLDSEFDIQLKSIYKMAKKNKLWENTYAISSYTEYWAEGVQCFFNTNLEAIPTDGIHNNINTRDELKIYDPELFTFIGKYFKSNKNHFGCY